MRVLYAVGPSVPVAIGRMEYRYYIKVASMSHMPLSSLTCFAPLRRKYELECFSPSFNRVYHGFCQIYKRSFAISLHGIAIKDAMKGILIFEVVQVVSTWQVKQVVAA